MSPLSLLLVFCLAATAFAEEDTEPDPNFLQRSTCADTGDTCILGEAECSDQKCRCPKPGWGKGNFRCYEDDQIAFEIKNDPSLTTFNNETVEFPLPCRYLAADPKTDLHDKNNDVIGSCNSQIFAFNARSHGKFYLHGFDLALHFTNVNTGLSMQISYRLYGLVLNGVNQMTEEGTYGQFNPNGPWGSDSILYTDPLTGVSIDTGYDADNNRYFIEVKKCGMKITFVPYDIVMGLKQKQVPGMSVSLNTDNNPRLLTDAGLALANGITLTGIQVPDLTVEQSFVLKALGGRYIQNQPFTDYNLCHDTGTVLHTCSADRQKSAMRNCLWMLQQPKFVKCFDDTEGSTKVLGLFKGCVNAWCVNRNCGTIINSIRSNLCHSIGGIWQLNSFIAGHMCPRGMTR